MSDDLVKRLRDPAFGAETTERNMMSSAADRIEELEAKLAKAVEFVECTISYAKTCGARFPVDLARTTLAELKGETDE